MGGVDAAVGDELLQRQTGDLPADGLEAGDGDGLRRVVDDEVNAGQRLDGADIAALAADDAALHLVIGQGNHADGHFGHGICGAALDGLSHHLAGAGFALFFHAGLDLFDFEGGLVGHLGLHLVDEVLLCLLGSEAGNTLQHFSLAALDDLDLFVFLVDGRVLLGQRFFLLLHGFQLAVQVLFLLLQAVFLPLQVSSALLYFLLILAAALQNLFFCFHQGLALLGFRAFDGLVDDALSLFFSAGDLLLGNSFAVANTEREADRAANHQAHQGEDDRDRLHGVRFLLFFGIVISQLQSENDRQDAPTPADNYPFLV